MPGSKGKVLRNLLDITAKKEIDRIETELLFETTDQLLDEFDNTRQFFANDILEMHRRWLGSVYEWAGKYRQVKMSKGNFMFAAPVFIPHLMENFEKELLTQYTPCLFKSSQEIAFALAIVHTELILIHPFREGNGRIARLLATLMALQAGLPLLDFSGFDKKRQEEYFAAIQQGLDRNYKPMTNIFSDIIARSMQEYEE